MSEPESSAGTEALNPPAMSLAGRLGNIFVAPSEVFDELKVSPPRTANWLVPFVLVIITGIIYVMVVFSQSGVLQRMHDDQDRKYQQMVDQGKLTRQQADNAAAMVEKWMTPGVFKVFGILGVIFVQAIYLFLVGLIIWLLGDKLYHGNFGYMKSVEAVGLASIISVPGSIVAMLLAVIYANLSMTPGPVLLISNFDPTNKVHLTLSALNLASIWYVAVLAIALGRLSGVGFLKAALWGYGLWALFTLGPIWLFGGK